MILTEIEVVSRLICSYEPYSAKWRSKSKGTDFEPSLVYSHLGDLASFLSVRAAAGATSDFTAFFEEFERLLQYSIARNLLIVGFLEDLQNVSLNRGLPLDLWDRYLGPKTKIAWEAIKDVWSGKLAPEHFNALVEGPLDSS